jgi:hypothetical protein
MPKIWLLNIVVHTWPLLCSQLIVTADFQGISSFRTIKHKVGFHNLSLDTIQEQLCDIQDWSLGYLKSGIFNQFTIALNFSICYPDNFGR